MDIKVDLIDYFKTIGFSKKSRGTLINDSEDVWVLVNFQNSKYGDYFFLNFGLWFTNVTLKRLNPQDVNSWHVYGRYESIVDNNVSGRIPKQLNDESLLIQTKFNIEENVLPFLKQYSSINKLRKSLESSDFPYDKIQVYIDDN